MCEHSRKLIAWMDGELAEGEAAAVAGHVAQCVECRECLAAYEQASAGFEAYCDAVVDVAEGAEEKRLREVPRLAENRSLRDDNVKQKHGGLKPAATQATRVRVAIAAAAAIAMVLMIPRSRVAQTPVPITASSSGSGAAAVPAAVPERGRPLHAVQRPAQRAESAGAMEPAKKESHQSAAAGPARFANANGAARGQTAQAAQVQNVSAALRPKGESKPQAENASADDPPIEIAVPTDGMFPPGAIPAGIGFTAVVTISADDSAQLAALRPRLTQFSNGGKQP